MMSSGGGAMQALVADEVNKRLTAATADLENKYASGHASTEQSADGPTGKAYQEKAAKEAKMKKAQKAAAAELSESKQKENNNTHNQEYDDEDDDGEEDNELRMIREQRMKQMRKQHNEKIENLGKGHGQYREIVQDQFLTEMTSSDRVICHFYHRDFTRCTIMDHHLQKLVGRHVETKFVKINADKTPFFVDKLKIRTMPTLVLFFDGVAVDKIVGFEGLCEQMPEGREDEWPTISLARLLGSKGIINANAVVDDEGIEAAMKSKMENMRKQGYQGLLASNLLDVEDEDDDFNLDD